MNSMNVVPIAGHRITALCEFGMRYNYYAAPVMWMLGSLHTQNYSIMRSVNSKLLKTSKTIKDLEIYYFSRFFSGVTKFLGNFISKNEMP